MMHSGQEQRFPGKRERGEVGSGQDHVLRSSKTRIRKKLFPDLVSGGSHAEVTLRGDMCGSGIRFISPCLTFVT